MSGDFTRRTHIVRISDAGKDEKPEDGNYIDVEVLDAICFHIEGGKEVVLHMKGAKAFIEDKTDGGNGKDESNATRRSHIKRLKGENGSELDVETIECAAFNDQNGGEWVLNMKDPGNVVDTEDSGSGGGSGDTRRGHTEKITVPFGGDKNSKSYVKMQRHDMIAFRREGGKEVILKMPSGDDPNNAKIKRAATFISSPEKYDPTDDEQKVPKNEDPNVYFAFVKDKSESGKFKPFLLGGDTKIVTGPLWWIRKINVSGGIIYITVKFAKRNAGLPTITLTTNAYDDEFDVLSDVSLLAPGKVKKPEIVDPVSNAMMTDLLQWTPKPLYKVVTSEDNGVWVIDTALWTGVFNHHCTGQVSYGEQEHARLEMAQALYDAFGDIGGTLTPPDFVNFGAAYLNNVCESAPGPPDPQFFANGGTAHFVDDPIITTEGEAVIALNVGLLTAQLKKDDTELTFTINVSNMNSGSPISIAALGYKKLRKFPLDAKNVPQFKPEPPKVVDGAGHGEITGHIALKDNKELDITYDISGFGSEG